MGNIALPRRARPTPYRGAASARPSLGSPCYAEAGPGAQEVPAKGRWADLRTTRAVEAMASTPAGWASSVPLRPSHGTRTRTLWEPPCPPRCHIPSRKQVQVGLLGTELYPQTWMSTPLTRTVAGNRVVVDDRGTRARGSASLQPDRRPQGKGNLDMDSHTGRHREDGPRSWGDSPTSHRARQSATCQLPPAEKPGPDSLSQPGQQHRSPHVIPGLPPQDGDKTHTPGAAEAALGKSHKYRAARTLALNAEPGRSSGRTGRPAVPPGRFRTCSRVLRLGGPGAIGSTLWSACCGITGLPPTAPCNGSVASAGSSEGAGRGAAVGVEAEPSLSSLAPEEDASTSAAGCSFSEFKGTKDSLCQGEVCGQGQGRTRSCYLAPGPAHIGTSQAPTWREIPAACGAGSKQAILENSSPEPVRSERGPKDRGISGPTASSQGRSAATLPGRGWVRCLPNSLAHVCLRLTLW